MSDLPPPAGGGGAAPAEAPPAELATAAEPRQTVPFLVLQFFLFPLGIVAVCVAVFVIFGLIAGESRGAKDYLAEIRSGSANRRWQAAFELSKVLQAGKDKALSDPKFAAEVQALFRDSARDDPRVRRYLALALGRLRSPEAVPDLLAAARPPAAEGQEPDADTRIYAIWALGAIGDASAVPELVTLAEDADPGIRKAAVHALGTFPGDEARAALVRALADATDDVRWNAALALARRGDPAAQGVLLSMMDRDRLAAVEGLTADQREDAVIQAVTAAAALPGPEMRVALERLRDRDPNLKVREAARHALEGMR
jgi:HEAT repeat protein